MPVSGSGAVFCSCSAPVVTGSILTQRSSRSTLDRVQICAAGSQGRRTRPLTFGEVSPVSPFGLLVVEAFDRGMPVSDWIGFYRYPDPRVIAALDDIWRKDVWPAFTAHFGIA